MEDFQDELSRAFSRLEWDLIQFKDGDIHAESFVGVFRLEVLYKGEDGTAIGSIEVPARVGGGITLFRYGTRDRVSLDVVLHKLREYCGVLRNQVEVMCNG